MVDCLPANATRDAAREAHDRAFADVLELDLDFCTNSYGISTCTAGIENNGTAQAGSASTITLAAGASGDDDEYNTMVVAIISGTGAGQGRVISDYVGATKVATVAEDWDTNPDATSVYAVIDRPNACYNTFHTCQDTANFVKGTKTYKFISQGAPIPIGVLTRPYIKNINRAQTRLQPEKGLASRNDVTLTLKDEPDDDRQQDPYVDTRATAAVGSFWARLIARNPHYSGRFARLRRGYVVDPWDWDTFLDEYYTIESITGPDAKTGVTIKLKDPLKLADRNQVPLPTDGKVNTAFKAIEDQGAAQGGAASTIILRAQAKAVDDYYNGMAVKITGGFGTDQERIISDYVGVTRVATVSTPWAHIPTDVSIYEVQPLELELDSGKVGQYADPGVTGKREYVRVDKEIIEYTAISGDKLTWPDTTHRAQFGSIAKDHSDNANVQQCLAAHNTAFTNVIKVLLNAAGITDSYIDTAQLASEQATWLATHSNITTIVSEPIGVGVLLGELAVMVNANIWWCPAGQVVKFAVNAPRPPGDTGILSVNDSANIMLDKVKVTKLDKLRITRAAMWYAVIDATETGREAPNFERGIMIIDADAEGANAYDDVRPKTIYSRWFSSINDLAARIWANRRIYNFKRAPLEISLSLDPKDYTATVGDEMIITTDQVVDNTGAPKAVRGLIVSAVDKGKQIDYVVRSTLDDRRFAFIAPNGTADYPTDTDYCHIAQNSGLMSDGGDPYIIF